MVKTTGIAGLICLAILGSTVSAQHDTIHRLPALTADTLEHPPSSRTGIGIAHDEAGLSPEDQRLYDQGLAFLHNYIWIDAARAFRDILRRAPGHPLASLGLSYAYSGLGMNGAARDATNQARTGVHDDAHAEVHVGVREAELRWQDAPADRDRAAAYKAALDAATARFPQDEEFWLLRGMAEAAAVGDRGQASPASAVVYYKRAIAIAPEHFAGHHYLTHAYENASNIPAALAEGKRYAELAPSVPHARHMFGHDLRRSGHIREAIDEFEKADQLQRDYFAAEQVLPETDWHYEHNLDLLGTSYQYIGQTGKASALLHQAFMLPTANLVQAVNKRQWPLMLRALEQYDAALVAAEVLIASPQPVVQAAGRIEKAHVLMVTGHLAQAADEANAANAALRTAPAGQFLLAIPMQLLHGEFMLRDGRHDEGVRILREAMTAERAATGPDEWTEALFEIESIARVARETGAWDLAAAAATAMIAHDPEYGGSHLAVALVAAHNSDNVRAAQEFRAARQRWANADPDFPPLKLLTPTAKQP